MDFPQALAWLPEAKVTPKCRSFQRTVAMAAAVDSSDVGTVQQAVEDGCGGGT